MQEKEILLKAHYEVGKKLSALRAKLEVFESEYEAIGNRLAELERDKNLINRFRQYEDEREFKALDTGKIPQLRSTNPAKKRKVEETVSAAEIQFDDVVQEEIIATAAADSGIVQTIQLEPDSDNVENIQLETELVTVIVDAPPPTTSATAFVPPAMASAPPTPTVTAFVPPADGLCALLLPQSLRLCLVPWPLRLLVARPQPLCLPRPLLPRFLNASQQDDVVGRPLGQPLWKAET